MQNLTIVTLPNAVLRQKAKAINIKDIGKLGLKELARKMIIAMRQAKGIGLAAPQIGKSIRFIVVEVLPEPLVLINPVITHSSFAKELGQEGCLSIPGQWGFVKRAIKVDVEGYTLDGKKTKLNTEGLLARVIQHEVDHLDGVLFIDKVDKSQLLGGYKL